MVCLLPDTTAPQPCHYLLILQQEVLVVPLEGVAHAWQGSGEGPAGPVCEGALTQRLGGAALWPSPIQGPQYLATSASGQVVYYTKA